MRYGLLVLFSFLLHACVTGSPPVRYYLLTPTPAAASKTASPATTPVQQPLLVIEPVELPPYLNRTHIVTRSSSNHLQLAQFEHWGDTLRDNISRVLLENLSSQLGSNRLTPPTTLQQEKPAYRLATQISQFELGPENRVTLQARWRLLDNQSGKTVVSEQTLLHSDPINPANYDAIAAAMSELLHLWCQEMVPGVGEYVR
ncbi:MAG: membrane integrity-associated transporter subunit PqiC [Magnetococcales bacterium]|nr:membrane integrity-associated transporter subunit PqiC [Magnetococcales bacterium]